MRIRSTGFIVLLLTTLVAAKPVGRVESLQGDKKLFRQEGASAPYYRAYIEQDAEIGHHFRTDPKSMASIRFFLGGNVGLGKDCEIVVVNERDAKILSQGNYWMKFDKQDPDNPIRIQTAGGVMGIRGTELVLKVDQNGDTELSLLEGKVEVEAANGDTLTAEPGMRVTFGGGRELRYTLYKVEKLFEKVEQDFGPEFLELRKSLLETRQAVRDAKLATRTRSLTDAMEGLGQRLDEQQGRRGNRTGSRAGNIDTANAKLSRADELLAKLEGREVSRSGEDGTPPDNGGVPPDNGQTDPSATPAGVERMRCSVHPSLVWPGAPDDQFTILFLDPDNDSNIFWIAETTGSAYTHPGDAQPFEPGPYTLRVVPRSDDGRYLEATDYPIQVEEPR